MPRLGVLTTRSKARSSSSLTEQAEVGVGVADLRALEEAGAADDGVGDLEEDEALLEGAHLEGGADQDGDVAVAAAAALPGLDVVGDEAGLGVAVPDAADAELLAGRVLGPERLAEAPLLAAIRPEAAARMLPVER
jgi:hypothetical protein